jgi:hypothetical protein
MNDDFFKNTLAKIEGNDPKVTEVFFQCDWVEPLVDDQCQMILKALKSNDYVKTFFVSGNYITRAGLEGICETKIDRLDISFMDISEDIVYELIKMPQLTYLDIEGTKIEKLEHFKLLIENLPNLRSLLITSALFDEFDVTGVNKQLKILFNRRVITKLTDDKLEDPPLHLIKYIKLISK